jgi:hypothetical protein
MPTSSHSHMLLLVGPLVPVVGLMLLMEKVTTEAGPPQRRGSIPAKPVRRPVPPPYIDKWRDDRLKQLDKREAPADRLPWTRPADTTKV